MAHDVRDPSMRGGERERNSECLLTIVEKLYVLHHFISSNERRNICTALSQLARSPRCQLPTFYITTVIESYKEYHGAHITSTQKKLNVYFISSRLLSCSHALFTEIICTEFCVMLFFVNV